LGSSYELCDLWGTWSSPCVMSNEEWEGLLPTFWLVILCF
jgi:hypothetical protein